MKPGSLAYFQQFVELNRELLIATLMGNAASGPPLVQGDLPIYPNRPMWFKYQSEKEVQEGSAVV